MSLSKKSVQDAQDLISMKKGDPEVERAVKLKTDWNLFQDYLKKKGLAGHPDLDKGVGEENNGIRLVRQYQKENPSTLVTPENIKEIQSHFQNYREYAINQLRTKKAMLNDAKNPNGRYVDPKENLDFFMKDLSRVDGVPGQFTSQHRFPDTFLTTIYKDPSGKIEKQDTENKGLATTN